MKIKYLNMNPFRRFIQSIIKALEIGICLPPMVLWSRIGVMANNISRLMNGCCKGLSWIIFSRQLSLLQLCFFVNLLFSRAFRFFKEAAPSD